MAATLRLPLDIQARAVAYASSLGISMNALVVVALVDYLDVRRPLAPSGGPSAARAGARPSQGLPKPSEPSYRAPKRRTDPCPCGALDSAGRPVRWKHCHGKPSRP